jgi:glyoxylase-like metal-dependent hydrolase (beta-lactamase superfamily II)/rhodanese-related sulfurtransferase
MSEGPEMNFKQFYLGCLSHASYYIGSDGEAVVIDPQRDVEQYIDEATANRQQIRYIIETHSHADFVSGHLELAAKTGAEIVYGIRANTQFPTLKVSDGDELTVGDVNLRIIETPGHTPEGITIVAEDRSDNTAPPKMFTGDTLFIGDVGRPDLIGSKGFTAEQMGEMLYDSLHEKILGFPDETEVYPAHGAGSLCGRSLSRETWSTLGEQRRYNYALQPMSKDEFVRIIACDQPEVPMYFPRSAAKNLEGSSALEDLAVPRELDSREIRDFDGIVIDVRPNYEYGAEHIPNAINIGLGGQFASWAGTLIPIGTPIAIVAETVAQMDEAVIRLARVGHDTVIGYILNGDYDGERKTIMQLPIDEVDRLMQSDDRMQFVDVRRAPEHNAGHATGTIGIPLDKLERNVGRLDPKLLTLVICHGGYRSSIGTSILENAGFEHIYNVTGGTAAWIAAGLPTETVAAS